MSKYEELSKLKELLDAGVLNKEEFEAEKKKILDASEEVKPTPTKKPGFFSKKMFCFFLYIRLLSDNRKDKKKEVQKTLCF